MLSYAKYLPWFMLAIALVGLYFQFRNFKAVDNWYKGIPGESDPPPVGQGASPIG